MRFASRFVPAAAAVLILAGCAGGTSAVHQSLSGAAERTLPRKVLLLPIEVRVHEVSAGGVVEKVDAWTETASGHAGKYIQELSASSAAFQLLDSPHLTDAQRAQLEQHVALYELVAGSAYLARQSQIAVWQERAKAFDYTLGPGLKPLADETGLDAAMIVIGSDYISTAGRRAAMVMGVVLGALAGVAVAPQGGVSFISVGVVDMRSGNLLWFGTERSQATDFRNEPDLRKLLEALFRTYPGLAPAQPAPGGG
jgi:hypothetical protein